MIDLINPTNFNRSIYELEEFWLVAVSVAGKNGPIQAKKVHEFLGGINGDTPFEKVNNLIKEGKLKERLQAVRLGQYKRIERAFSDSLSLDLNTCTLDNLESIAGVGCKTSRFFLLHSRPDLDYVVLDTHILRFLREECGLSDIPKSTPTNSVQYANIETRARKAMQKKFPNDSAAGADIKVWLKMSGRAKVK